MRLFNISYFDMNLWTSWSKYLEILDSDIASLQNFLNVFNPDYKIWNDPLPNQDKSITWHEKYNNTILSSKNMRLVKNIDNKNYIIYFPFYLDYRQGLLNTDPESYIYWGSIEDFNNENNKIEKLEIFPQSTTVISLWESYKDIKNRDIERKDSKNYIIIPRNAASFYYPTSANYNSWNFDFFSNAQDLFGTSLYFTPDFFSTRYILKEDKTNIISPSAGIFNALWTSIDSAADLIIRDKQGKIWINNFPLQHYTFINNKDSLEEIFFDCSDSIIQSNVENHSAFVYTLNIKNLEDNIIEKQNFKIYLI